MPNVLIGVCQEQDASELREVLIASGYGVRVSAGCPSTRDVASHSRDSFSAIVLDSRLVAASTTEEDPTNIVADLRRQFAGKAPILVYMTRDYHDLKSRAVRDAIWDSNVIVDAPTSAEDVLPQLRAALIR